MRTLRFLVAAAVGCSTLLALPACDQETGENGSAGANGAGGGPREAREMLTLEQARERAARVSEVRYAIAFELDAAGPEYTGNVTSRFQLSAADGAEPDLAVDFSGGTVRELVVNGSTLAADYNGFFITLPGDALVPGENTVEIAFAHPYSNDGAGLYRFADPEDDRLYLYTDFEPYHQNRLFPSFDQPDLKARYTTEVTVPASWTVIANVRETAARETGALRVWSFPETLPISTYIYALHAGDYHLWEAEAGGIPLRLFARESLVPYVYPEHWFLPTQQGLAFFQEYFGVAYPFAKYDQVIVPHFNAGAMENVAAVTFSERYLRRGVVTRQDRRAIASVILHEMAHMWFGDLVTMDWWNGLWLNESFATYMSTLAMVEATEFTDEWQSAYRRTIRAYDADERDTTHPIEMPTPDTDTAFANFDAITYNKGSAVLTQLGHLVGPEAFREGVSRYLQEHAFGNATIGDFIGAISAAAGRDLDAWSRDWLSTPGTNTVEASFVCVNGQLDSIALRQTAPEAWPVLRQHRTQLGLYRFVDGGVAVDTLPVDYSGAETLIDAAGQPCPDLIYANHGDWDFVRVRLDSVAIERLRTSLNSFDDSLSRAMLWQSLYDLVLDAGIPPADFIRLAVAQVADEPVDEVATQVVGAIQGALGTLARAAPGSPALQRAQTEVEEFLWRQTTGTAPGTDRQLMFFDSYIAAAAGDEALARLRRLLGEPAALPVGIALDQDRRWTLIERLSGFGAADVPALLEAERAADPSDNGRLRALAATAAWPAEAEKRRLAERLLTAGDDLSVADARAIGGALLPRVQQAAQRPLAMETLSRLPDVSADVDPGYFGAITGGLLPILCDEDYLEAIEDSVADSGSLHPTLQKTLLDLRFDVRRCLRIAAAL